MKIYLILLIVFGCIFLILFTKINIRFKSSGEQIVLNLKILFIKLKILPAKDSEKIRIKKTKKKAKKDAKKQRKTDKLEAKHPGYTKRKKKKTKDIVLYMLTRIADMLSTTKKVILFLFKRISISVLRVHMVVGREFAADTAIDYGRYTGALYIITGALHHKTKFVLPDISSEMDYSGAVHTDFDVEFQLGARVYVFLFIAIIFIKDIIKIYLAKKDSSASSSPTNKNK